MDKRGQITAFIIVGLVILIVIILAIFARNYLGIGIPKKEFLQINLKPIQDEIGKCADSIALRGLNLLGRQGGDMNPVIYRLYKGDKIRYLCLNIPGDRRCMNNLDPLSKMEKQLNDFLNFEFEECVELDRFKPSFGRYELTSGKPKVDVKFLDENVLVDVDYPVKLSKEGETISMPKIKRKVDVPIGGLYYDAYNIVQSYATLGEFDSLPYMLGNRGQVEIITKKPYPDIVYILNRKDSGFVFQFAIEGEEESIE